MPLFSKKTFAIFFIGLFLLNGVSYVFAAPGIDGAGDATTPTPTSATVKADLAIKNESSIFDLSGQGMEAIGWAVVGIIQFELWVLGGIGFMLEGMIQFPILKLTAVVTLWTLIRDFVNLGFVFGMAIIAIGTMLDIGNYTAKKILLKLITAALLVNFTLVFIGFFLDLNNIGSAALIYRMTKGSNDPSQTIESIVHNGSGEQLISEKATPDADKILNTQGDKILISVAEGGALGKLIVKAMFLFIIMVVFLIIFFSFIVRIAELIPLVILSPLIWTSYAFGTTIAETDWKGWWAKFMKWCFMPTISLFYIYLAFTVYAQMGDSFGFNTSTGTIDALFALAINTMVLGSLLSGAIKAAWESSGALESIVGKAIMVAGSSLQGMLGKVALGAVAKTGLGALAKNIGGNMAQKGLGMQGGPLGLKGLAGKAMSGMGQVGQKFGEKSEEGHRKTAQEDIKKMSDDTLKKNATNALKNPAGKLNGGAKAQQQEFIKAAMEKGLLKDANADQLGNMMKSFGSEGDLEKRKELMASVVKSVGNFKASEVNKLIATGGTKGDMTTQDGLIEGLAKAKKLESATLDAVGMNTVSGNNAMKLRNPEAYKAAVGSNIMYDEEVVKAPSAQRAQVAATKMATMNTKDAASINMTELANDPSGKGVEAVTLSGNQAVMTQYATQGGGEDQRNRLRGLRQHLATKAGGPANIKSYVQTNLPELHKVLIKPNMKNFIKQSSKAPGLNNNLLADLVF